MRARGDRRDHEAFMMTLGAALHRWGTPAHRLEARMSDIADRLGIEAQFFSTPTSLMAGFGPYADQSVRLARIDPGSVNLSKLLELDRMAERVAQGELTIEAGLLEARAIDARRDPYGTPWVVVAFALVSAGAARFFGGGLTEIGAAVGAGVLAGTLAVITPRAPGVAKLFELLAAMSVTLWVIALQGAGVPVAPFVVILSGLIVLVPGLTLTMAVSELATKNVVSGSARLISSGMTLLQIGFGVALAQQVALRLSGPLIQLEPVPLPPITLAAALLVLASALIVLFQAPRSLLWAVVLVTTVAVLGARLGTELLGPALGSSVGALFVALVGNLYARWRSRPAVALIVPGMLVLVPGSLGFRSVNSLIANDPGMGIETAFNMGLVAVSIVTGLLVANVVLPPRTGRSAQASL